MTAPCRSSASRAISQCVHGTPSSHKALRALASLAEDGKWNPLGVHSGCMALPARMWGVLEKGAETFLSQVKGDVLAAGVCVCVQDWLNAPAPCGARDYVQYIQAV